VFLLVVLAMIGACGVAACRLTQHVFGDQTFELLNESDFAVHITTDTALGCPLLTLPPHSTGTYVASGLCRNPQLGIAAGIAGFDGDECTWDELKSREPVIIDNAGIKCEIDPPY
jgi:hypothetical protein